MGTVAFWKGILSIGSFSIVFLMAVMEIKIILLLDLDVSSGN